ncbi:MAG: helix-turn-helix transcriptional regulator [Bacteroidales bacterium]|nr:helix-turn-helix transcriptional regulator [Bacteroidales bacterium]
MKERLRRFIEAENISQAQFADRLGITRASVSHILSGRNKPGFDFIQCIIEAYPSLSPDWIINGTGKMYRNAVETAPEPVKSTETKAPAESQELFPTDIFEKNTAPEPPKPVFQPQTTVTEKEERKVKSIIILYNDGTFQVL